ncbi:methyltransferase domain-containing protein [Streptomyces sp. CNQ085]|uniref:methyltransferase domain-containing protein n=1 Tax=Streptomyces sp. CNQ085 TaxID=2886944 RepID=UPI001F5077CA|nr:methyltransferase domain-containing protein [Streptomyces sp. CNQ085]MCI0386742.1 methyltransferase domain-containing protein [Streptomyces sp. CNQ085]
MRLDERSAHLAGAMAERGLWPERSPWIRRAVEALPRHRFAPDRLWSWDGSAGVYVPVDRAADPGRWAAEVYAGPDDPAVTQITDGLASSSLSCPAVVVDMLDSLLLEPGRRVLELGTGTGWNAALLAHRTGPGRVTSVEVDASLAAGAEARLAAAGAEVAVRVGDGAAGWPQDASYDRLIATYAVEEVPWAWVEQTRPGGRIVTPWGRLGHVALTAAPDGRSATGWIQGLGMFMPARGTDPGAPFHRVRDRHPLEVEAPFPRALGPLAGPEGGHLLFALRVLLPEVHITTETGDRGGVTAWLHDGHSSWATVDSRNGPGSAAVAYQGGPRRLADEVLRAWTVWEERGAPGLYDFGLTRAEHEQWIWSGDPNGPRWQPLTPAAVR